jgi:hypothetical protein
LTPPARRWVLVAALATVATAAAATAPRALRNVDSLRVARVQVAGARYLDAEHVVAVSGITETSSIFDDVAAWRASLENHPLVLRATIRRRLPDALRVDIVESRPIALLRGAEPRAVDARGQVLPIEAARFDLDLPEIASSPRIDAHGRITDASTLRVVDTLDRVLALQPWLVQWVAVLEPLRDGVRVRLRWPAGAEVLLPPAPDATRLHDLRLAFGHLAARAADSDSTRVRAARSSEHSELARLLRLDARFRDQIVVRLRDRGSSAPMRGRS